MKTMDKDIVSWILEMLLRQDQLPESLISKILSNPGVPVDNNNLRFKKTILLRSIDSEISDGSVSETILDSLEAIEEIDRKKNIKILDSMKIAYCAVALDCTVKYLWGNRHKRDEDKYSEAGKRIWSGRIRRLEMKNSELVTNQLRKWRKDIGAVLSDSNIYKKFKGRNTRNDALILTGDFVDEAMTIMGPPFLQLVARVEREAIEIVDKGEIGRSAREARDDKVPEEEEAGVTTDEREKPKQKEAMEASTAREGIEIEDRNAEGSENTTVQELGDVAGGKGTSGLPNSTNKSVVADTSYRKGTEIQSKVLHQKYKLAAGLRSSKGLAKTTDSGELNLGTTPSKYDTVPTPEVEQTIETLKSSSIELQSAVEDPLPNALHVADTVVAEMMRTNLDQETLVGQQSKKDVKYLNQETSVERENGKDADASDPLLDVVGSRKADRMMNNNLLVGSQNSKDVYGHEKNVIRHSLMKRNSTAHTYEWDDSIDGSPEATNWKIRLDSPKRKNVSPLKKYEAPRFTKRRKMKKWSLEEEDALREGVKKYGMGNWKLILNSNRELFEERTEVDLKDKWRNMMR